MKEIIDIHQTITIINIINLCNNNTSQVITITTTVMIMTIKIKESLITIVIEDTKKYSTYPIKDKKYVCQRGQFEGFHVESVEFCKLKIAQGPPGPQRSPGATGATGGTGQQGLNGDTDAAVPPRITQLNATNTYQIGESFLNNFTTSYNLITGIL